MTDADARELGRLFGFSLIVLAAAVVFWRSGAFERAAGWGLGRRVGFALLFFVSAAGVFGLRTLALRSPEEQHAAFTEGCEGACRNSDLSVESCAAYCACTLAEIRKELSFDELLELTDATSEGRTHPDMPKLQTAADACKSLVSP